MKRSWVFGGFILTFILLIIHLLVINDFGLTWDFHHIFFTGLRLIRHPITPDLLAHIPFGQPAPWDMYDVPFGQLMPLLPAVSYTVLFEKLKVLAFDSAFHLPTIIIGTSGLLILYLFLLEATSPIVAIVGFSFLTLYPRYFSDIQNNMKDVPQVVMFALSIWLFWRLVNDRKLINLFLAALSFAISFNVKVNAIFIPLVVGVWFLILLVTRATGSLKKPIHVPSIRHIKPILIYFLLAPALALLFWMFLWENPIKELLYIPRFFQDNTQNIEVLYFGKWYCSAVNVPWHYPFGYLAIVTPIPILILALVGMVVLIFQIFKRKPVASLLLLWFFIPISRYLLPKIGVIDGIRHFEEVVFPLCAIAAVGAGGIFRFFDKQAIQPSFARAASFAEVATEAESAGRQYNNVKKLLMGGLMIGVIAYLVQQIVVYHPFQITYFNELVGGLKGAFGKFDLDYWGTSQKQAMAWLNTHAPQGSKVYVAMAADVAAKYLRPDLLEKLNTTWYDDADYVVVLNRQSFFYRYFYIVEYMLMRKTAYVVELQGVPLVWIYDNSLGQFPRGREWWHGDSPCIRKYWTITP